MLGLDCGSSMDFLQRQGQAITLASYDGRLNAGLALCGFVFTSSSLPILTRRPQRITLSARASTLGGIFRF